jgi:hypothetical protein
MQLVEELIGRKVTVFTDQSGTERQDVVTLEAVDQTWLKARKGEDITYFNIAKIRLVRPFEP